MSCIMGIEGGGDKQCNHTFHLLDKISKEIVDVAILKDLQ